MSAVESGVDIEGRTIFMYGEICDQNVSRVVTALAMFDTTEGVVRIVMSSGGGHVDSGNTLYDSVRMHHNPVVIDAIGTCQSVATMILQAASVRRLSTECRVMVHEGQASVADIGPRGLVKVAQEVAFLHDRYIEILAERSGMDLKKMRDLCTQETFISSQKAIELGLADEILDTYNPMIVKRRKRK